MNASTLTGIRLKLQHLFTSWLEKDRFVLVVLALVLVVRLGWVLYWPNEPFIGDEKMYKSFAEGVVDGKGFVRANGEPTANVMPGYPVSLALWMVVFGDLGPHNLWAKLANVVYSMGILICTYALGRRLFSENTARLGLLLMGFFPNQIAYNSLLATDVSFTLLLMASLVLSFQERRYWWTGVLLGVLIALASYVKSLLTGFFPFYFLCLWAVWREWKPALVHTAIAVVVAVVLLFPWAKRNHTHFGSWGLCHGGMALLVGNNPEATGQFHRPPLVDRLHTPFMHGGLLEAEANRESQELAYQFMRDNPGHFLRLGIKKMWHMYRHDKDGVWHVMNGVTPGVSKVTWKFWSVVSQLYYLGVMALMLVYWIRVASTRSLVQLPSLLLLVIGYFSLVYFVYHAMPRYHFTLMPIFSLYAAQMTTVLLGWGRGAQQKAEVRQN